MSELTANTAYEWDETLRELAQDDGSDLTLDKVDIIAQELLDKTQFLYTKMPFTVKAQYDFAELGGTIGAIGLGVTIPDNAIIMRAYVDVLTTCESAADTATIALHAEGADDIVAAIAINDGTNPWDAGLHEGIEDGTVANAVKTTAARELTATIAVQDLTAGKFNLFVEYVLSD